MKTITAAVLLAALFAASGCSWRDWAHGQHEKDLEAEHERKLIVAGKLDPEESMYWSSED